MKNAMLVFVVLGTFAACTDDQTPVTQDDFAAVVEAHGGTMGEPPANQTRTDGRIDLGTDRKNAAGQCCWGHCNTSGPFWNGLTTSGCRAWVVDTCHSGGQAFDPNGDAWWGNCPS